MALSDEHERARHPPARLRKSGWKRLSLGWSCGWNRVSLDAELQLVVNMELTQSRVSNSMDDKSGCHLFIHIGLPTSSWTVNKTDDKNRHYSSIHDWLPANSWTTTGWMIKVLVHYRSTTNSW
jgi:hypothetical protein